MARSVLRIALNLSLISSLQSLKFPVNSIRNFKLNILPKLQSSYNGNDLKKYLELRSSLTNGTKFSNLYLDCELYFFLR